MIVFLSACKTKQVATISLQKDPDITQFYRTDDIYKILDQAEKEDKLVYVDIYTDWCLPCKIMNESVYSDQETMKYLDDNFICYKVNGEQENGPDLVALFEVSNYPGILFLNKKGGVIEKNLGSLNKAELMAMGDRALTHMQISAVGR